MLYYYLSQLCPLIRLSWAGLGHVVAEGGHLGLQVQDTFFTHMSGTTWLLGLPDCMADSG